MELAAILDDYRENYLVSHHSVSWTSFFEKVTAMDRMIACRTSACGEVQVVCPECHQVEWFYHSCGHRNCPKCQNHETSRWLDRQLKKLLPVDYFMVTFTLPAELRPIARSRPTCIYDLFFKASSDSLKELSQNPRYLEGNIGCTGVLHTHNRRLDYHLHVHYIVPGLAYDGTNQRAIHTRNSYLVPGIKLGRLFRGKFLHGLKALGISFPSILYRKNWVVDCQHVGKGESALKYLSQYLYRGVISENNILSHENGLITFRYIDSETKKPEVRTLPGIRFVNLVLQHVLPKGFRRVRDYGFLNGNAKMTLVKLQLALLPRIRDRPIRTRPAFICPCCFGPMKVVKVCVFRFGRDLKTVIDIRNRSPPPLSPLISL